ncbi:hypothetical protein B6N60_04235 [Richelia sinica FACHB-800]|uniref:Uncharacterized protein n=1 Tax=Richelia sinica FACHB-800 TaxID=1357546 RepID=A0A975TBQ2_9NOST|nr:hypothetical protein [Richelia sinica]MBD2666397.1 hypothetical protein [Richelia sinica FACHB-800]QXE25520.1 hypothetical protein B6N60_04235 [Richelia sinica FACHB-800]
MAIAPPSYLTKMAIAPPSYLTKMAIALHVTYIKQRSLLNSSTPEKRSHSIIPKMAIPTVSFANALHRTYIKQRSLFHPTYIK